MSQSLGSLVEKLVRFVEEHESQVLSEEQMDRIKELDTHICGECTPLSLSVPAIDSTDLALHVVLFGFTRVPSISAPEGDLFIALRYWIQAIQWCGLRNGRLPEGFRSPNRDLPPRGHWTRPPRNTQGSLNPPGEVLRRQPRSSNNWAYNPLSRKYVTSYFSSSSALLSMNCLAASGSPSSYLTFPFRVIIAAQRRGLQRQ